MTNKFKIMENGVVMTNSAGYQQVLTTLTEVSKKLTTQKFYEIAFADFVPVVPGEGSFKRSIGTWKTFSLGGTFEDGIIGNASNDARIGLVNAGFDFVTTPVYSWAKAIQWNIFELEEAMQANQIFSLVEAREVARRKEHDLGLQRVAFFGVTGGTPGLLNQSTCTDNTTALTNWIKSLSADNFGTFVGSVYALYRANCNYTAKPTHFAIPESDYNGLVNWPSATYPLKTKLELLLDAFRTITGNKNFQILPLAYGDKANGDTVNNKYALYNYDETSVKMSLPIPYTPTAANSINGFTWENVGYSQFSGVQLLRPAEFMYFSHTQNPT